MVGLWGLLVEGCFWNDGITDVVFLVLYMMKMDCLIIGEFLGLYPGDWVVLENFWM